MVIPYTYLKEYWMVISPVNLLLRLSIKNIIFDMNKFEKNVSLLNFQICLILALQSVIALHNPCIKRFTVKGPT